MEERFTFTSEGLTIEVGDYKVKVTPSESHETKVAMEQGVIMNTPVSMASKCCNIAVYDKSGNTCTENFLWEYNQESNLNSGVLVDAKITDLACLLIAINDTDRLQCKGGNNMPNKLNDPNYLLELRKRIKKLIFNVEPDSLVQKELKQISVELKHTINAGSVVAYPNKEDNNHDETNYLLELRKGIKKLIFNVEPNSLAQKELEQISVELKHTINTGGIVAYPNKEDNHETKN